MILIPYILLAVALAALVWAVRRGNVLSANLLADSTLREKTMGDLALARQQATDLAERLKEAQARAEGREEALGQLMAARQQIADLTARLQRAETSNSEMQSALTMAEARNASLQTEIEALRGEEARNKEMLENRFSLLAQEVLKKNTSEFGQLSQEKIGNILEPLKQNLEEFKRTVRETYDSESRERFSLGKVIESLKSANETISREARGLTQALKGSNQVQGQWGEMILESILERSGLTKGREYDLQVTTDTDGNPLRGENGEPLRPDAVVYYPDDRCVVIDSKVSLAAFMDLANAEDDARVRSATERLVVSVRAQVKNLSGKHYQDFIGKRKLDYVLMFVPNEAAFLTAMGADAMLWDFAFSQKVAIVSPTSLVSTLRLIEQLWNRDKAQKNAEKIALDAGNMYNKFVDFVKDMETMDTEIGRLNKAFGGAMNKLKTGKGNLIKRAENLRALGIPVKKRLKATDEEDLEEGTDVSEAEAE